MIKPVRSFAVLVFALAGCSPPSSPPAPSTSPALEVFPAAIHTGTDDSGAAYVAPIVASDTGASFEVSGSCCTITSGAGQAQITARQAGSATVTVSAGGHTATVAVEVTSYTSADRTAGQQAYAASACGGCHDGAGQPDITSSGIPEHPDDQVLTAIRSGINPEGGQIEGAHSFQVPDGIVAYLRSLPPKGLPAADE
jgi:mono/diheme cytochrome c family protein